MDRINSLRNKRGPKSLVTELEDNRQDTGTKPGIVYKFTKTKIHIEGEGLTYNRDTIVLGEYGRP